MALSHVTKDSILKAIAECERKGYAAFIKEYGHKNPKKYWLHWNGKKYSSKAIANVAQAIGMGLPYDTDRNFYGGKLLVNRFRDLGFDVREEAVSNPDWSRDELILALDLYSQNPEFPFGKTSKEVRELSQLLSVLGAINDVRCNAKFRNPNGVYLKMMNFRALDPQFTEAGKKGMVRGQS